MIDRIFIHARKKDGGAPIEKYVIERREKGRDQWQKVFEFC